MTGVYAGRTLRVPLSVWLVNGSVSARNITAEVGNVRWRSTIPGGYADCTIDLNRPLSVHTPEIAAYTWVKVTDSRNGAVVYQGRLEDPGKTVSESGAVWSLTAFGLQAHTKDITAPYVAVDADLSRWVRGFQTKTYVTDSTEDDSDPAPSGGLMGPSIKFAPNTGSVFGATNLALFYYPIFYESGQLLGSVIGAGRTGPTGSAELILNMLATNDQTMIGTFQQIIQSGFAALNSPQSFVARKGNAEISPFWTLDLPIPVIQYRYGGGTGNWTANTNTWAMVGDRLTVRPIMHRANGTQISPGTPADHDPTRTASHEVVNDLLGGGRLPMFDGATAVVTPSPVDRNIFQFAYPDPVSTDQLLNDLMIQEPLCYWAVWETTTAGKGRFEWVLWPNEIRHIIPMTGGIDLPTSTEEVYNAVSVRWKDALGRIRRTVRTATSPTLAAAGIARREASIDLGDNFASLQSAEAAGDGFLADHAAPRGTGTVTVASKTLDRLALRGLSPWELRPGCIVQIAGADPSGYSQQATTRNGRNVFRVVATEFDASSGECRLELDSPARSIWDQVATAHRDIEQRRRR